jgi:hypothetical protein
MEEFDAEELSAEWVGVPSELRAVAERAASSPADGQERG